MNRSIQSLICGVLPSTVLLPLFSPVNLHTKVLRGGFVKFCKAVKPSLYFKSNVILKDTNNFISKIIISCNTLIWTS